MDQYGNERFGLPVAWTVAAGGRTVNPQNTTTDSTGLAWTTLTLGTRLDVDQSVEAALDGLPPANFTVSATLPSTTVMIKEAGDQQEGVVAFPLADSLEVRLQPPGGALAMGVQVEWRSDRGGSSVSPRYSITDSTGCAAAEMVLGRSAVENIVIATEAGLSSTTFRAWGVAGDPDSIAYVRGDGQRGFRNSQLGGALTVRVRDQYHNPIRGLEVQWIPTDGGGSAHPPVSTTDSVGLTSTRWMLGTAPGNQSIEASAGNVSFEFNAFAYRLLHIETFGGVILDVEPERVLLSDSISGNLVIHDRVSQADEIVVDPMNERPGKAYLTPFGAIYIHQTGNVLTSAVHEWRNRTLEDHGHPNSSASLEEDGQYAIWSVGSTLVLYDLIDGTTDTVSLNAGNTYNDVTETGEVVYWGHPGKYNIYRYRSGVTEQLTNDDDEDFWNVYPVSDGINIVYTKQTPCCFNQTYQVFPYQNGIEVALSERMSDYGMSYLVNNGWVAYRDINSQIWVRSPQGFKTLAASIGGNIESMNANGDIVVQARHHYLIPYGGAAVDFGPRDGWSFWDGDTAYVVIGSSLYTVMR